MQRPNTISGGAQDLTKIVMLSGIAFPNGTEIIYEGSGGDRIPGYRSWILRGIGVKRAVLAIVDLEKWSEVMPKTALKMIEGLAPQAARCQPMGALTCEWKYNGKNFAGTLLECQSETYLELEIHP